MLKSSVYAPIIVFGFNRPEHLKKTISTLAQCELANLSEVIAFIDGPKGGEDVVKHRKILDYLKSVTAFLRLEIRVRDKNIGLEKNISSGVTDVMDEYGRAIILEDDILVSKDFLRFMNESLDSYKDKKNVWHISGWNFPLIEKDLPSFFLWRTALGWGWATWADRWQHYHRDPQALINMFDEVEIQKFNIYGSYNFWEQVVNNATGKICTWAVFWYGTIFKRGGLCLNPTRAMTTNIGFDGSGTHDASIEHSLPHDLGFSYRKEDLPVDISENRTVLSAIIKYNNNCNQDKQEHKNKTISDLKKLIKVSLSHPDHFSSLAGKKIAIFGVAELSLLVCQLLQLNGIYIHAFFVSAIGQPEYIESIPVALPPQWPDVDPHVVISCIEGNHEHSIERMISEALPGCSIISWRSL